MQIVDILFRIPFTYMHTLKAIAGKPQTVLDIGCGEGTLMTIIGEKNWDITGIDVYEDCIKMAKATGMYKKLITGDVVKTVKKLIKEKKKYDLVFCSQVIEHITREDGEELLKIVDQIAKKRIYFGTPNGYMHTHEMFADGNPHQDHRSGWVKEDFKKYGYKVNGVGLKLLWSEDGIARTNNKVILTFITLSAFLFNPIVYYFPNFASGLLAVKDISDK